jgi:hypothetical protein
MQFSAKYEEAFKLTVGHEGGYQNRRSDRGTIPQSPGSLPTNITVDASLKPSRGIPSTAEVGPDGSIRLDARPW